MYKSILRPSFNQQNSSKQDKCYRGAINKIKLPETEQIK